ncbi:unnamed protein product [Gongylonema pulchrum]|uniref:ShlB/FhaC/HecB family hemolysin secretion/activation protein n=1 Tax=Gongylonema pulchrum TaxID=637853 RepID=A0A183DBU4_9BILA|nr:unnamed protein product [Gongylonema pulchrum]
MGLSERLLYIALLCLHRSILTSAQADLNALNAQAAQQVAPPQKILSAQGREQNITPQPVQQQQL